MNLLQLDLDNCSACGLCAVHCSEDVITPGTDGKPRIDRANGCLECGHCIAVCPTGALRSQGDSEPRRVHRGAIAADALEHFLRGKRSCRGFEARPVDREALARLVDVAHRAPSSKNCEERTFIVVTDRARLDALRRDLVKHTRRVLWALRLITSRALRWTLPAESVAALRRMARSFEHALAREARGADTVFYQAPAVIFIGGIGKDIFGKDNALAAQHYLMLQAEAMGLGSSIMGYAQSAPGVVARHLRVPRFYQLYGVVAVGHPRHRFAFEPTRKPAQVEWVEAAGSGSGLSS